MNRALQYRAWEQSLRAVWAAIIAQRDFRWIDDEKAVARFIERLNKYSAAISLGRSL